MFKKSEVKENVESRAVPIMYSGNVHRAFYDFRQSIIKCLRELGESDLYIQLLDSDKVKFKSYITLISYLMEQSKSIQDFIVNYCQSVPEEELKKFD